MANARLALAQTLSEAVISALLEVLPTDDIIALLIAEGDKLNLAIEALQGPIKRRGRPLKNPFAGALAPTTTPADKRKSGRSAAARKAQSQRMKAYWAAKRKRAGTEVSNLDLVEHRGQRVFLFLILAQGAHSIEECVIKLYEVFLPARFVSSLVSNDLALGFVVANAALVAFGLWCWAVPVRSGWRAAPGLIWFWTILELGNGISHSAFAL